MVEYGLVGRLDRRGLYCLRSRGLAVALKEMFTTIAT